jgi:hypothetical protein
MKRNITLITVFLMLLCVPACQAKPLDGTWKSTGDLSFVAKINDGLIKITWLVDKDNSGLYWKGTFPKAKHSKVTSVADTKALDASIYGSTSKTKQFTVSGSKIAFVFQALGTTHTINLVRK